jgi:hypothetical protein
MPQFKITYTDPETQTEKSVIKSFETFVGRSKDEDGNPVGPLLKITAYDWACDYGYSLADKGQFDVEELD